MTAIEVGKKIPKALLPSYKDKNIVLYFYPRDDTPGCTTEGLEFSALQDDFQKANTVILGVSRDTPESHEKFKCKYNLAFELLSDTDEKLCEQFAVIKMKNMYGKKVRGIERSTFLIDKKGVLRQEWRSVKAAGHAEKVLAAVQELE